MAAKKVKVSNVPNLRFPGFEGEWQKRRFGEIVDFKVTNSYSRDNLNYLEGKVKNIHYGDIHTKFQTLFDITKENVPYINNELAIGRISEDNYCKEGDIVFADASEDLNDVGKSIEIVNLNGEQVLSGLHTLLARPKEDIFLLGFVGYLLKSNSIKTQIQKESQGSKVLSISVGRISNITLTIAAIQEQKKIAGLLSLIDLRIQTQNKIIIHYQSLIHNLRDAIFKKKIGFKDHNGKNFPKWERCKLKDIAERVVKKNFENDQNVLTISAQYGLISQLDFFNKSVSAKDVSGYYSLSKDDFAYNKSYSTGYPMGAIKRLKRYNKGVVSTLYICFRFNNKVNQDYMEHYFESQIQNSELEKIAQEGARNHGLLNVGISDFFNIEIQFPNINEQVEIAKILSSLGRRIVIEKNILEKLKQQKNYLLQNLFI